ncbi:MAG: TetR/AcrR family transcriptional regulator [Hyphomonadaceae bacterium]|nr:TetR/AcrR family transcriptional regulator [Hyphomonadaceae bacterium]
MRTVDTAKHDAKSAEILDAAERCIARRGFHATTIAQICDEAGISPGHLYHYFESKVAIMNAISARGLEYVETGLARLVDQPDPVDAVLAEVERFRSYKKLSGGGGVLLEILSEAGRNPAIAKALREHTAGMRKLLAEFLRDGQKRGKIDTSLDPDMAAIILISILDGCKTLAVRDPKLNAAKFGEALETLIGRFLRASP